VSHLSLIEAVHVEKDHTAARREQLGSLFDAQHQRLYRLARRLSRDPEDARDLVQETFLRAARGLRKLPVVDSDAEAWLVRILVNLCRDRSRKIAVRRRFPQAENVETLGAPDPESAAVARATVQTALASLSPRRRTVIVLHELEQLPVPKIAEMLGLSKVTVRWHLSAARKGLAGILTERSLPRSEHETRLQTQR
jgi:RNA polymerase sigma-70 factor (ECF subfamily)